MRDISVPILERDVLDARGLRREIIVLHRGHAYVFAASSEGPLDDRPRVSSGSPEFGIVPLTGCDVIEDVEVRADENGSDLGVAIAAYREAMKRDGRISDEEIAEKLREASLRRPKTKPVHRSIDDDWETL